MIRDAKEKDLPELHHLIAQSVHACIEAEEVDRENIIVDSLCSSEANVHGHSDGVHLVYEQHDQLLGMILIKEYWNMASLFVRPDKHHQGVATALLNEALEICRDKAAGKAIRLNSSHYAAGFYEAYGFIKNGPEKDLPGGCIPYLYYL